MAYYLSRTMVLDTAFLEDPYGHDLEMNVNTFIFGYVFNTMFRPLLFEIIWLPLLIWTEISIFYQFTQTIFVGAETAPLEDELEEW